MESFNNSDTTYILEYYPYYTRNRIGNRFGRYGDIWRWSMAGLLESWILTLFSDFRYDYSYSCRMQFCFWYSPIICLWCAIIIFNRIRNRFGSSGDCMSWSMIFFDLCLHYKGLIYFSHRNVNFTGIYTSEMKLMSILVFWMLIHNLQSKRKSVR